jgi:hypothetical protein
MNAMRWLKPRTSQLTDLLFWVPTLMLGATMADARTWRIRPDGLGDAPTIQAGIAAAVAGDSIVVAAGTYNENLDMRGKTLTLRGESGPTQTVIDGGYRDRVLAMSGGVVDGLTLQAGLCRCDGAGIYLYPPQGTTPPATTIRNCIIQDNHAGIEYETGTGGGLYFTPWTRGVVLESCVVRGNSAQGGGGGVFDGGFANRIEGNVFIRNRGLHGGGGIASGRADISNNLVAENFADLGPGGIELGVYGAVRNNTVVANATTGTVAAGVGAREGIVSHNIIAFNSPGCGLTYGGSTPPDCNDLWHNEYDACGEAWSPDQGGNFAQDPLFCDMANHDYSLHDNSPCLPGPQNLCGLVGGSSEGCGTVLVKQQSWGSVKELFR